MLVTLSILLVASALIFASNCPESGIAFTSTRRNFHRLKNRTSLPSTTDFDNNVTLALLLNAGDDRNRWSQTRAARVEGYVQSVAAANPELTNCYCGRDIHIHIGLRRDVAPHEQLVLEITPRLTPAFVARKDGSIEELQRLLIGHWVRFEGWLMFDIHHADESENIMPGRVGNWRATAWEIHPVTRIEVMGGK